MLPESESFCMYQVRRQLKEAQGALDTLADSLRVMSKLHANRYS